MDFIEQIKNYLEMEKFAIDKLDINAINDAMNLLEKTRINGGTIFICGNGGSAATASHFKNDFAKGISYNIDKKYNVVCLSDNLETITAIANDDTYDNIFYKQVENIIKPNDILIAISGSGNSKNIIKVVEYVKKIGCKIISMTGFDGGELYKLSDIKMHIPTTNIQIAEDIHMIFNHCIMYILYNTLNKCN